MPNHNLTLMSHVVLSSMFCRTRRTPQLLPNPTYNLSQTPDGSKNVFSTSTSGTSETVDALAPIFRIGANAALFVSVAETSLMRGRYRVLTRFPFG